MACSAPRKISPRCAPQNSDSAKMPGAGRRELDAERGEDVEGREDQHQHRRAAHDVDIGSERPAHRAAAEGQPDADEQPDD